jgi:hypothetical protein
MYSALLLYSDEQIINKKQSSNTEMNLRTLLRSSRPISELGNVIGKLVRNELGNRALKSDLKTTIILLQRN